MSASALAVRRSDPFWVFMGSVTRFEVRWQRRGVNEVSLEDAYGQYADELVRYATLLVPESVAPDVVADTFADLLGNSADSWASVRNVKAFLFGAVANRAADVSPPEWAASPP